MRSARIEVVCHPFRDPCLRIVKRLWEDTPLNARSNKGLERQAGRNDIRDALVNFRKALVLQGQTIL